MKINLLKKYFFLEKKKQKKITVLNEIKRNLIISFQKKFNVKNKKILKIYYKFFKKKILVSDNVIITKDINLFLKKIKGKNFYYITNMLGYESFNNIYNNFLNNKNIFFFEDLNTKKKLCKIIKSLKAEKKILICVGGGKVTDLAKFIALKSNIFLITIPTILATHVYASPKIHALKIIKKFGYNNTINGNPSSLSIIDMNIINRLFYKNPRLIYSGMGDLMAFYNSRLDWMESNQFNIKRNFFSVNSIYKIEKTLETINIEKPINKWIKKYIFAQVLLCNITNWVGSAPASGSEHFFANIYEKLYPNNVLHGELVAVGTLFFRYIRGADYKKIILLMKKFKISNSLKKLNIKKFRIIKALSLCRKEGLRKNRFSILNKKKLSKKDFIILINEMIKKKIIIN